MADAMAVLGDTASIGIDDVIAATFDGELVALDRALDRVQAGRTLVQEAGQVQQAAIDRTLELIVDGIMAPGPAA